MEYNFKKGDRLTCINHLNSDNILVKGKTYIATCDSYIHGDLEYVNIELPISSLSSLPRSKFGIDDSMFYSSRFTNIKDVRKDKLKKLNLCLIVQQ